jgi:hypothetical protein
MPAETAAIASAIDPESQSSEMPAETAAIASAIARNK